ncbi:MAG: Ig-like domain-containing protein, partial [Mycobacteriales bacterium]
MRNATRRWEPRSRPFVALVVLTAWFGSLLVAAPLDVARAASSIVDPTYATPPARGNAAAASFAFDLNADADPAQCQWVAGNDTVTLPPTGGWGACTSPYVPDLTSATDGFVTVWVRSVHTPPVILADPPTSTADIQPDPVPGDGRPATYDLDRIGPTLTVATGPAGPSAGGSKTVTWVVSAADTGSASGPVTCTLKLGTATFATGLCGAADAFPGSPLGADGSYTLTATSTDADGNTTVSGTLATYTLDTSGPALTLASGPTGPGKNASPTWSVTAAGGATVSCDLFLTPRSATPTATTSNCASFAPGALADGTYELEAKATDTAGNTRTQVMATYALDTVAPAISVSPASTSSTSPAAGWTVAIAAPDAGLTPTCTLTNGATSYGTGTGCGQFTSFALPTEGTYTLTASVTDAAGNTGTATGTWLYRGTPTVSVATAKTIGNSTSVDWAVSAPGTADLTCTLQGAAQPTATTVACAAGTVSTTLPNVEDTYTFTATAKDLGTGATGSGAATYELDTTPLPAFTVTGTSGDTISPAVSWAWTATGAASSCQLKQSGVASGTAVSPCTSPWTTPLTADGAWTLDVTLYDAAGNATVATSP